VDANGNINIVWEERVTADNSEIFFMGSTDGGNTFTMPLNISRSPLNSQWANVAVDGFGNIYVVWLDYSVTGIGQILFRRSSDGVNWVPPLTSQAVNISNSGLQESKDPKVTALGNGTVYAIWDTTSPGPNCEVRYRKSTDGGNTWNPPLTSPGTNLSVDPGLSERADIKVVNNGVNDIVYVAWDDNTPGNFDIFFRFSTDGGNTWNPPLTSQGTNISRNLGVSQFPRLAIGPQGDINVVWCDTSIPPPGNTEILFSRSTNGTSFSTPLNVSRDPNSSATPHIGVNSKGFIFVMWADNGFGYGNYEIFFSCSTDGGQSFSAPENISRNPGASRRPELAIDKLDFIYVVWYDDTDANLEIFFTHSLPPA
jgi:hypothetical protein